MLFNMYNESFESGSLPKTLREASITLLLKKNKDPQSCGSKHKHRFSFFNIRRLFNIIYHPSQSTTPEVVVSLDAEKAFDRVEWRYLFYTLEKFGFGHIFREGQEHRVSLYADNLLIYLSDSSHSLPSALNILETFGKLSGYKMNVPKSKLFPVNEGACSLPLTLSLSKLLLN